MNLFQQGPFTLHSGERSSFKIECDSLCVDDWRTLANMIAERCRFSKVRGIPRGGLLLAEALLPHVSDYGWSLVVDDVWTTGRSMLAFMRPGEVGYVVFARKPVSDPRVGALFTLDAQ